MIDENNRAKVTDFGIARAVTSSTVTIASDTLGSVHYISPEQARGGYTDEKSDIYSLGIVMYEMITGKLPFNSDTAVSVALKHIQEKIIWPSDMELKVPKQLENIILKCVSKSQSDRYQKMSDLIVDLKNIDIYTEELSNTEKLIEDSPTMVIPTITEKDIEKSNIVEEEEDDDGDSKSSGRKTTILAILLALLVVGGMFYGYFKIKDIFSSTEIIVPDFVGMSIEDAEEEAKSKDLELLIKETVESDEYDEGVVTKQNQKAGSKVKSGYVIEVTVSEGGKLIKLPNFVNQTFAEAKKTMEELGLEVGETKYNFSDITPKDYIMDQSPNAYTFLSKGDKIIFTISRGEEMKSVIMPRVVGRNSIEAQNKILDLGLSIGTIKEEYNKDYPKGVVYFQSTNEGQEIKIKTPIDLYVSKGPEPAPEPIPEPKPEPKPEVKPEPKPEVKPEPKPEPEPNPEPEPVPEPDPIEQN